MQVRDYLYRILHRWEPGSGAYLYFFDTPRRTLVDSGTLPAARQDIEPFLRSLGLTPSDIHQVIHTHGHHDHIGSSALFQDNGAKLALHRDDVSMMVTKDTHLHGDMTLQDRLLGLPSAIAIGEAKLARYYNREVQPDRVLEDGDQIDLGGGVVLTTVHTPGHTAGSVCFYWEQERLMLTGDAIQVRGTRPGNLPQYVDPVAYVASMKRLQGFAIDTICMGHAYGWSNPETEPVRHGPAVGDCLTESITLSNELDAVVQSVAGGLPGASFIQIAQGVAREMAYRVPIRLMRGLDVPANGCVAIHAHLKAHGLHVEAGR